MELDKIYLGDCYELIKNIPDKSIDLIVTDPPYEFDMGSHGHSEIAVRKEKQRQEIYNLDTSLTKKKLSNGYVSGGGCFGTKNRAYHSEINDTDVSVQRQKYLDYVKEHGKDEESERLRIIANQIDQKEDFRFISHGITNEILDQFVRVMKKINIYIWCNKNQLRQLIDYFDDKGCFIDLLTWHKTNPIPTCNNTYLSDTEYCVFARESGVKIYGTTETKKKYYVTSCNKQDKDEYLHPTIKPLNIIENLIINSSVRGGVVLDAFIGSGTTAVAAKNLDRKYIGFELNPKFYQIAIDRLNGINASGQTSLLDTDFDKLQEEHDLLKTK